MKLIDADALLHIALYNEQTEEDDYIEKSIEDVLDTFTLEGCPPAQPETHEKRTETHACGCISRQAAKLKVARVVWEKGDTAEDFNDKCVDCLDDVQPEEAIPVSWIEGEITEMKSTGETLPYMLAELIGAMVRKWKEEQQD